MFVPTSCPNRCCVNVSQILRQGVSGFQAQSMGAVRGPAFSMSLPIAQSCIGTSWTSPKNPRHLKWNREQIRETILVGVA
jgi:hypothetical protein